MAIIVSHNATIANAQAAAGDTNILDRGMAHWDHPAMLRLVTTIGATPTATFSQVLGSVDGTSFYPVPYADSATPGTLTTAAFGAITTAQTKIVYLQPTPWRYLKMNISAVTNVTSTIDVFSGE
ncbi:MAG TPA: hypothetical protein VEM32_06635 [Geobacteraceae bacterium]|nr:hypothetical protein [Geobacteraceae bacterium]